MTNHFTKSAESALHNALLSASDMGHTYIGSEHILLGLISEAGSIASKVLEGKGISRERIYEIISGKIPFLKFSSDEFTVCKLTETTVLVFFIYSTAIFFKQFNLEPIPPSKPSTCHITIALSCFKS